MRSVEDIERAKDLLNAKKTEQAVISLPPGFIAGFRLRTENGQMFVGKGVMNCRGKAVYHKTEDIIDGNDYLQPDYIIKGVTYYVYMNFAKEMKIDTIASVWDDDNFGYYHPTLYQYRFLGQFYYGTDGTYTKLLNQDPVIGTDINANEVASLLVKTLLAQVTDYIVVGQDPDSTPEEEDWACFIYEDRMEIKQYLSGTWVVKTKWGSSATIEAELYIGFTSFSGTTTLDSPGEGDTVHYINGTTDQYQEYTNGGWVVTATGIKLGGLLAGTALFLNMIGGGGMYHPNSPPTTSEQFPNQYYRVFDFENDYEDQNGVDDWTTKSNTAFNALIKKYGSYSLTGTSGTYAYLLLNSGSIGILGESQTCGGWFRIDYTGTSSDDDSTALMQYSETTNYIQLRLYQANGGTELTLGVDVHKNGIEEYNETNLTTIESGVWHYIGFAYNKDNDRIYIIVDNEIYDSGVIGGTWDSGSFDWFRVECHQAWTESGIERSIYVDELLFYWDKYLDPNILAQHYTHDTAWDIAGRAKADLLLRPDTDGRIYAEGLLWENGERAARWHKITGQATGHFATKTTWTGTDNFSSHGWVVDFSSVVSPGTKAVICPVYATTADGTLARAYNDSTYCGNTPFASGYYHAFVTGVVQRAQTIILLDNDYKAEFTVLGAGLDLYIEGPVMELW